MEPGTNPQTTNANGMTSFTWTADFDEDEYGTSWGSNLRSQPFGLEVTVDDGNGQPVSSLVVVRVYNRQERIRVMQNRFLYAPGETFSVEAIVETVQGEPVRGRVLTAEVTRYNRTSRDYDTITTVTGTATNESGRTTLNLTLAEPGYYYLSLRSQDASGRAITLRRWLCIYRPGVSNWAENYNAISIQANADQYAPSDTAQLTIESGFAEPASAHLRAGHHPAGNPHRTHTTPDHCRGSHPGR
ncbi:MAG: hypothetical protein IPL78_21975 [Chloroflexi bacterium]|nr:hypothetical protein [Chloroflexota bacterium]